jgi:hypothetical protein
MYKPPYDVATGYQINNESDAEIDSLPSGLVSTQDIPSAVDPTTFHKIENQGSQGSCQGQAISSMMECCFFLETGQTDLEISRNFAYRASQQEDNIRGDLGSTLSGGIAACKKGLCREMYFPYTDTYSKRIPKAAFDNRAEFQIEIGKQVIGDDKNAEFIRNWIGSGLGAAVIGVSWNKFCENQIITDYRSIGRSGGHAVVILGYTPKTLIWANSWGRNVFKDGYQEITDSAFNKMMQPSGNRLVVYSDIKNLEPRIYPDLSSIRKAYDNE